MNSDKKQLTQYIIFGVLVAVLAGYLAFTLIGRKPAPTQQAKASPAKSTAVQNAQTETNPPDESGFELSISPIGERRDPFAPAFCADDAPRAQKTQSPAPRVTKMPIIPPAPVSLPQLGVVPTGTQPPQSDYPAPASPPVPEFKVAGIITGENNVAVIDSNLGGRQVVREGQRLSGGYRVVLITKDGVVIKGNGQTIRIKLGGVNNAS